MAFFTRFLNRKPKSVLTKQRVKRQGFLKRRRIFAALLTLAILTVCLSGFFIYRIQFQGSTISARRWLIVTRIVESSKFKIEDLEGFVQSQLSPKILGNGSKDRLSFAAQHLMKSGVFEFVSIRRIDLETLLVKVRPRTPFAFVDIGDEVSFITRSGEVFKSTSQIKMPEPDYKFVVTGIFSHRDRRLEWTDRQSLNLSSEESRAILEYLDLIKAIDDAKLDIKSIHHLRFRGFVVKLSETETDVTLGYGSFEKKLVKLKQILGSLNRRSINAERIELDFEGKAFIKERKG